MLEKTCNSMQNLRHMVPTDMERAVYRRVVIEGVTQRKAAQEFNLSQATVCRLCRRAMRKLAMMGPAELADAFDRQRDIRVLHIGGKIKAFKNVSELRENVVEIVNRRINEVLGKFNGELRLGRFFLKVQVESVSERVIDESCIS